MPVADLVRLTAGYRIKQLTAPRERYPQAIAGTCISQRWKY